MHPWEFGWEALVAIGTLALAIATTILAWTTRNVAIATAAEVSAQWRPVLLPATGSQDEPMNYHAGASLRLRLVNAGAGPALHVRATLDPLGQSPDLWNLASIPPGIEQSLMFSGVTLPTFAQLLLDYRDLAGRTYSSALVIDCVTVNGGEIRRFYDARLFADKALTDLGDALPQEGLKSLPDAG